MIVNDGTFEGSILDWEVKKQPTYYKPNDNDEYQEAQLCATVRQDTYEQIGTVGKGYEVIQNSKIYEGLCNALEGTDFEICNMGTTDNGGRVFIQADVGGHSDFTINGDPYKGFLSIWTSHDGSCSTTAGDTANRMKCFNQFNYERAKGKNIFRMHIRKTKSASYKFDNMMIALSEMVDSRKEMIERLERIMNMPMSDTDANLFTLGYHNSVKSRGVNLANHIHGLYRSGMGNNGETRYDMFNAFTEFHTHGYANSKRSEESQIKTSLIGAGHRTKNNVLSILEDNNKVEKIISRGRELMAEVL